MRVNHTDAENSIMRSALPTHCDSLTRHSSRVYSLQSLLTLTTDRHMPFQFGLVHCALLFSCKAWGADNPPTVNLANFSRLVF